VYVAVDAGRGKKGASLRKLSLEIKLLIFPGASKIRAVKDRAVIFEPLGGYRYLGYKIMTTVEGSTSYKI
jgi:hypothetical protein